MFHISSILVLILALWLLATLVLILHRFSPKIGLIPLAIFLGGLTTAMQLSTFGWFLFEAGNVTINLDSYLLFPVLLFGLLIIYVVSGTLQAQVTLLGVLLVTVFTMLLQIFQATFIQLPGLFVVDAAYPSYSLRILLASLAALALDMIALILSYQALSNLRSRFPSRLAGSLSLLVALSLDALVFPLITYGLTSDGFQNIGMQLAGKFLAGLALSPLLIYYFHRIEISAPDTPATSPRPVLDLFTTTQEFELRARYHLNLLRTLREIHQVIVRAADPQKMLQQSTNLLVGNRQYRLAWLERMDTNGNYIASTVLSGLINSNPDIVSNHIREALEQRISKDSTPFFIDWPLEEGPAWQKLAEEIGCEGVAVFPLRYPDQLVGVLGVCTAPGNRLDATERELLEELADDLAHALVSIEVRAQQTLLQTAAETMQDGIIITELDGRIVYVNQSGINMMHSTPSAPIGNLLSEYIPSPNPQQVIEQFVQVVLERGSFFTEFTSPEMVLSVNISAVHDLDGQPEYIAASVRDISKQRENERQLLTLHQLTTELVQIRDTSELMEAILLLSEDLLKADASGIYFINPDNYQIIDTLTHSLSIEYSQRIARDYRALPGEDARKSLQPVFVSDVLNSPTYGERTHFMAEYGIRALIILPIVFQGKPYGALTLYYQQPHLFPESEVQIGRTLVQTLAIVIQNARLYQAEQDQRQVAEALVRAAASLNSSLELTAVLDEILKQVMNVIPCTASNILMIEGKMAYVRKHRGYEAVPEYLDGIDDLRFPISAPNISELIQNRSVLIADTTKDDRWISYANTDWIKSYAGVPLKLDQEVVGFLNVDSDRPNFFTEETVYWLQIFADYAVTAIKNARLYQAESNLRDLAEVLANAARTLNSSLEVEEVLDNILSQAMKIVSGRAANLMLVDGDDVIAIRGLGYPVTKEGFTNLVDQRVPLKFPTLQRIVRSKKPCLIADALQYDNWQTVPDMEWVKSYAGIPLEVNQKVIGILNVDGDQPNQFTPETISRLVSFAAHAAAALQNAQLYTNSRRRAEEMAALVTAVKTVSSSLDFKEVLYVVAKQMTESLKLQACAISDYDPDKQVVTLLTEYTPQEWEIDEIWYQPYSLDEYPVTKKVLSSNLPLQLQINDPNLDKAERAFMLKAEITLLMMIPLVVQERAIGLVELMSDENNRMFTRQEVALAQTLASHAAIAIQNANLYQQLQDHAVDLEDRVEQRTRELQQAKERIEGILASVPDAVFVLDENRKLIQVNQAGEQLYQLANQVELDLFAPVFLDILERGIYSEEAILEIEGRAYQALSSSLSRWDQPVGQVIVFRDVTLFRELDRMKSQFVSDVSHELRTPLTNMMLYLGLIEVVEGDTEAQREYISIMRRETERLSHLIEDLLMISRLDAGRVNIQLWNADINNLMEELTNDRINLAAQAGITLTTNFDPDILSAKVDTNLLVQAISNLLTNAINYTPAGGTVEMITSAVDENGQSWVIIQVKDDGVGIAPDEIDKLFERFYRGSASRKVGASGTGLGLAISTEIITRMGGKITVESVPAKGSTFTVWLKPGTDEVL